MTTNDFRKALEYCNGGWYTLRYSYQITESPMIARPSGGTYGMINVSLNVHSIMKNLEREKHWPQKTKNNSK
jgi:hypothetical protein